VAMPWASNVPSILQAWYLGSEAGNAISDILTGRVNPSGKLPMTFHATLDQVPAHDMGLYPGTPREDGSKIVDCRYDEGVFVGYRWIDKHKITPLFPFGHGLSYTTFEYGKASVDNTAISPDGTVTVTVPVTNSGNRAGAEVVQLYISDLKSSLPRPVKELKGFKKINLQPGETSLVSFNIDSRDLSFFDPDKHQWICEPGKFEVQIGSSSKDIRSKAMFEVR